MQKIEVITNVIMQIFFWFYIYQMFYICVALLKRPKQHKRTIMHRFAVLIAARNEANVLGNLIDSIHAQDYPSDMVDIYVVADNCTDTTASVAALHGATVYERFDSVHKGKGYALNYLLNQICRDDYDAYLVFDADNILTENYITEINRTFSDGYEIITSYRNSKNYGDNWISAGYALCFLREAKFLNYPRSLLGLSAAVEGTGFLFSKSVLERCGGWHFFLMTEDSEFTIDAVTRGERIGYCQDAMFYDEQPVSFVQSWHQRIRWVKGYLQVLKKYGAALIRGIIHGSFACYDLTMCMLPAAVLTLTSILIDLVSMVRSFIIGRSLTALGISFGKLFFGLSLTLFLIGLLTTITEWHRISCGAVRKILYTFTFPFFMLTYLPISAAALFVRAEWRPIRHSRVMDLEQIRGKSA